jgi:hypothetical protein
MALDDAKRRSTFDGRAYLPYPLQRSQDRIFAVDDPSGDILTRALLIF